MPGTLGYPSIMAFPTAYGMDMRAAGDGLETAAPEAARRALAEVGSPDGGAASLILSGEDETEAFGRLLAGALDAGDTVLLSGTLGAGKSALARAILRARLADPAAEVPSPSYTLVNVYEPPAGPPVWHADLYRLGDSSELAELGLEDAFASTICLVEWPDRLPSQPARRLEIALALPDDASGEDVRRAEITATGSWPRLEALAA
ncbi:MAG: tRNA (adenosine(37)-N6)-threonylcarbamoyltransferase complex ATPase subunit type 1 TsaE [Pseudomonadota bacterium]